MENFTNFESYNLYIESCNSYNEDIKYLTYYLVSLYYKTDCKYCCSRAKINRLLTIYVLCAIKYNQNCLKNEYVISNPKDKIGIWFPKLTWYICRDVYFKFGLMEQDCKKITDEFNETAEIPEIFKVKNQVGDISKILLEEIFRRFGNYSLNVLAPMIDEIVLKIPIKQTPEKIEIDTKNFQKFLSTNIDNEVLNFIKEYTMDKPLMKKVKEKVKK